jgi:hypothetical protein
MSIQVREEVSMSLDVMYEGREQDKRCPLKGQLLGISKECSVMAIDVGYKAFRYRSLEAPSV